MYNLKTMKLLTIILLSLIPFSFKNNTQDLREVWGEPILITKNIDGVFSYDLSKVDPSLNIIFKFEITVNCPKDTIIIKPGYKKI